MFEILNIWVTHLVVGEVCIQCFCQHVSVWSTADLHQQHRGKQSHKKHLHLRAKHLHLKQQTEESNSQWWCRSEGGTVEELDAVTVWGGWVELINRPLHLRILLILKATKGCDWWRGTAVEGTRRCALEVVDTGVSPDRIRSSWTKVLLQQNFQDQIFGLIGLYSCCDNFECQLLQ